MRSTDQAAWDAFARSVTPLGQPKPPSSTPVLERVFASPRLDLHGLTLAEAHTATMNMLDATTEASVTVVTGLSGVIKKEFPQWFTNRPHVRIEELHGGGAYKLRIGQKLAFDAIGESAKSKSRWSR